MPTGFVERQLLLVVEAAGITGPTLPAVAGEFAGKTGRMYARLLSDEHGRSPVPFWPAHCPSRLTPGCHRRFQTCPGSRWTKRANVRVRVIHRRFWDATSKAKRRPNVDIVVIDRIVK